MAIFLIGGSNSLFSDGWVNYLKGHIDSEIQNLSIGASTSLVAIFRFLSEDGPAAGDTVIWEYALNEVTHETKGYPTETLLRNLERLLRLCRERGCKFAPVIMCPRVQELAEVRSEYFTLIHQLFDSYGIEYFDVSSEYRALHKIENMPADHYSDRAHYNKENVDLMEFCAAGCGRIVKTARVPKDIPPLRTAQTTMRVVNDFCDATFGNRLLQLPVATLPVDFKAGIAGKLIGAITLCFPDEDSGVLVRVKNPDQDNQRLRFSTMRRPDVNKPMVKAICLENIRHGDWQVSVNSEINMTAAKRPGFYYAEPALKAKLKNPKKAPNTKIAGLVIEVPIESVA